MMSSGKGSPSARLGIDKFVRTLNQMSMKLTELNEDEASKLGSFLRIETQKYWKALNCVDCTLFGLLPEGWSEG